MDNRLKFGLLMVAIVLAAFLLLSRKVKHWKQVAKTPAAPTLAETAKERPFRPAPGESRAVAQNEQDLASGLKGMDYRVSSSGKTTLSVAIIPKPLCHPADYEAMALATGNDGVLLSLEPLGNDHGSGAGVVTRSLSIQNLYQGIKLDLPVDITSSRLYGLYLCGDASNEGSCGRKKVATVAEILGQPKKARTHNDEIYFFQLMVMERRDALAYGGSRNELGRLAEDLAHHDIDKETIDKTFPAAGAKISRLESMPAEPRNVGGKLTMAIPLPFLNCAPPPKLAH